MKLQCLFITLIFLLSCTKEKLGEPILGKWTIIESSTSSSYIVQNYTPFTELTVQFGANGNLVLSGANPGIAVSPLWHYDKYELQPNNMIKFSQSAGSEELQALVSFDSALQLNYLLGRCGYVEKFLKVK